MEETLEQDVPAGGWWQRTAGEFGSAGFPLNATSSVLANALRVKSGAGSLFGFTVKSTNAAAQFVLLIDAATLPADGTLTVVAFQPFDLPGSSTLGVEFGDKGRSFSQGLWLCNSTTASTKTIGAADCWFDAQYL